jgi:hypothetical protein
MKSMELQDDALEGAGQVFNIDLTGMSSRQRAQTIVLVSTPHCQAILGEKLQFIEAELDFELVAVRTGALLFPVGNA